MAWVRKNFGRGEVVDLSKCKVVSPVVDEVRGVDDKGKDYVKTAYFIYADDIAIFRSFDKEEATLTFDWLIGKVLGARGMSAIATLAVGEAKKASGSKK